MTDKEIDTKTAKILLGPIGFLYIFKKEKHGKLGAGIVLSPEEVEQLKQFIGGTKCR